MARHEHMGTHTEIKCILYALPLYPKPSKTAHFARLILIRFRYDKAEQASRGNILVRIRDHPRPDPFVFRAPAPSAVATSPRPSSVASVMIHSLSCSSFMPSNWLACSCSCLCTSHHCCRRRFLRQKMQAVVSGGTCSRYDACTGALAPEGINSPTPGCGIAGCPWL